MAETYHAVRHGKKRVTERTAVDHCGSQRTRRAAGAFVSPSRDTVRGSNKSVVVPLKTSSACPGQPPRSLRYLAGALVVATALADVGYLWHMFEGYRIWSESC
ncbi:MAG: hypothetical protein CMO26_12455 [Thiotrichales bacterium]|nr:hypothetical protein [Thiotrichales bacterium]